MNALAEAAVFPGMRSESNDVTVVREMLKGPVLQVLRRLMPEYAGIAPERAYDHTLADLGLLEKCFRTFREQRDRFQHLLVDKQGRSVTNDTGILACGHNIELVVAMVVRTAAKRYFRNHIGLNGQARREGAPQTGLLGKMRGALSSPSEKKKTLAEELYDSIKAYLLFEWQVPLVPTYARMTPAQVASMGPQLLKYADEGVLARAAGLPVFAKAATAAQTPPANANPPPARSKLPETGAADQTSAAISSAQQKPIAARMPLRPLSPTPIRPAAEAVQRAAQAPIAYPRPIAVAASALRAIPITPPAQTQRSDPNGKKLSGASFAPVLATPQVQAAIDPNLIGPVSERVIDLVGPKAWAALILSLGLRRKDQLAVLILNAFGSLGVKEFLRLFGNDADSRLLDELLEKTEGGDVNPNSSLAEIIAFVAKTFAPHKTAAIR